MLPASFLPTRAARVGSEFVGETCDHYAREIQHCDREHVIYVQRGQTLVEEQETLLHELQHAMLGTEMSGKVVHNYIYQLTPKLLRLLQDNPNLVKYLAAR